MKALFSYLIINKLNFAFHPHKIHIPIYTVAFFSRRTISYKQISRIVVS